MKAFNSPRSNEVLSVFLIFGLTQVNAFVPNTRTVQSLIPRSSTLELDTEMESIISLESNELESEQKTFLDDGFVFGLEGSGLDRPKGKVGEYSTLTWLSRSHRTGCILQKNSYST